jgi:hypothetical protein
VDDTSYIIYNSGTQDNIFYTVLITVIFKLPNNGGPTPLPCYLVFISPCHWSKSTDSRLILIYLVAASLPIGLIPNPRLLQEFNLERIFGPVIQAIKEGNPELLSYALYGENREWFRAMGLWLIFVERLETLIWRVLIRKMYLPSFTPRTPLKVFFMYRMFVFIGVDFSSRIFRCGHKIQMPRLRCRYVSSRTSQIYSSPAHPNSRTKTSSPGTPTTSLISA